MYLLAPCPETIMASKLFPFHAPNPRSASLKNGFTNITASPQNNSAVVSTSLPPLNWKISFPKTSKKIGPNERFYEMKYAIARGNYPDADEAKQLIFDLCQGLYLKKAIRVMEWLIEWRIAPPDLRTCSHLVNSLSTSGYVGEAMLIVEKMEEVGFPTNSNTYNCIIRGLAMDGGSFDDCLKFTNKLVEMGVLPSTFTHSSLLEIACKEKGVDHAAKLFDEIVAQGWEPGLISYNVLVTGLCNEGRLDDAVRLFRELPSKGIDPTVVSYNILLKSLCHEGKWEEANALLAEMNAEAKSPSVVTYNMLISSLAFHGKTEDAIRLFREMERGKFKRKLTTPAYDPIIACLAKQGKADMIIEFLDHMISRNIAPKDGTYASVSLLTDAGKVQEAYSIIRSLASTKKCSIHNFWYYVLCCLCEKGRTYAAFQLLYEMVKDDMFVPDPPAYSTLMKGLYVEGMLSVALEIFGALVKEYGYVPKPGNFNTLMLGLCKAGRTDLSLEVFEDMIGKGIRANDSTYNILVQGIVNEGGKELAGEVVKDLFQIGALSRDVVRRFSLRYDLDV